MEREMDKNNFEYELNGFAVKMENGELTVNEVEYEDNNDNPTYSFAREIAKLRGLIKWEL